LQEHIATWERARAGASRIRALLDRAPRIRAPARVTAWPGLADAIRIDSVTFSYSPSRPALHDVSLTIPVGRRTAFVGPTGAGKSTLVQLLFRFRDPDTGRVAVDGIDIRALDPADLRRRIGLVPQAVHLLPGTVAENLGVDEGRAAALLAEVGLSGRLSPGTRIGEGGETVSRGEAQLLCFARAIATDPEVLVLDEATAAMDPATEARVASLLGRRTVVTVAHRLRSIMDHDCIHVIAEGRVVESGTHLELIAREGPYRVLWRAQLAATGAAA